MIEIVGGLLTQWDVKRQVKVTGEATHVHFANAGDSKAVILPLIGETSERTIEIPDYLLQTGKALNVYAVSNDVTLESRSFAVRKRERPEDYIYLPDQRDYIKVVTPKYFKNILEAVSAVNSGVYDAALTEIEGAIVKVDIADTKPALTLLQDVEQTGQLAIDTDMDLILNGHKLSMSNNGNNITVSAGASLLLDGTADGSAVNVSASSTNNQIVSTLVMVNGALIVKDGSYSVTCTGCSASVFWSSKDSTKMVLRDCSVSANSIYSDDDESGYVAYGVLSEGVMAECSGVTISVNGAVSTPLQYKGSMKMCNTDITATALIQCNGLIAYPNTNTTLEDVKMTLRSKTDNALGIDIQEDASLTAKGLNILAVTGAEAEANKGACGLNNNGTCTIEDSIIIADAKSSDSDKTASVGIDNDGKLTCKNTEACGTHSGVQNSNELYISKCLLSGVSHGGLYTTHTHGTEVIVNDTVLEVGVYRGQFTELYAGLFNNDTDPGMDVLSPMYVGHKFNLNNDGGSVCVDGCLFVGLGNESFTIRPAAYNAGALIPDKNPNRVYISRSKIAVQQANKPKGTIAPIRLNYDNSGPLNAAFAELYLGVGCNITVDNLMGGTACEQYMHNTGMLYRLKDQHLPTYEEYYLLTKEV